MGRVAKTLGFHVVFNDVLNIQDKHGCEQAQLQKLLEESDVITVHVDGREENNHLCNTAMFSAMKPEVLFMNASRGFVVDAYALTDFLKHNLTARAILDVHDPEPITNDYPLLHVPNATLYPHIACKTKTAVASMGWVVKDIEAVLGGKEPRYKVR